MYVSMVTAYPLPLTNCGRLKVIPMASVRALNHFDCVCGGGGGGGVGGGKTLVQKRSV